MILTKSKGATLNNSTKEILCAQYVRKKANEVFEYTQSGKGYFEYDAQKLKECALFVSEVIKKNYPDLKIPYHSRWNHFRAGKINRVQKLNEYLKSLPETEQLKAKIDLTLTSVLLDAGAGNQWKYLEQDSAQSFTRSEGLGVASFYLFLDKKLSSKPNQFMADADGLLSLNINDLKQYFQVSDHNPLVGLEGRLNLMHNLGQTLKENPLFKNNRAGDLLHQFESTSKKINAGKLLSFILNHLGNIWPARIYMEQTSLGDTWKHSQLGLVSFHKLSQWLTYSLLEPFISSGYQIEGIDELTGLAEYRNGGLFIDFEVLKLKDPSLANQAWEINSDLIIEWRALTVNLLDQIAPLVRKELELSAESFPLAKVLEGGTWWAGRELAFKRDPQGSAPLKLISDGTVF